uniref:Uncharacterized protein n=1 Tax=Chlamydomonas leiostraca TaxID=1034604 RepID=A0A7S0WN89_9CHLO|mmetsp:Transcript_20268/g.51296  ORF Transcript_20268/g.51296 Transcript_20268/m.51296 type:complete len:234 (+) Transcript_20268:74-775(+)
MSGSIGTRTLTGITLAQNPPYTHTWRDASSTHKASAQHQDIFNNAQPPSEGPQEAPWITEHTLQLSDPAEYTTRVKNSTLVHTGGSTNTAFVTHHTFMRPKLPVSTLRSMNLTLADTAATRTIGFTPGPYDPLDDPALLELQQVAHKVAPFLDAVLAGCDSYHLHCPKDGWITTTGFVVAAHKGGLHLTRAEFLALERAVPKDTLGRINYHHVAQVVAHLTREAQPEGEAPAA